ncbi:MAG: hypothetical protein GEU79_16720 [Acidimicrobiia bacterium]|nr:hypothetical protein [Acidimicrobiia bacterium]
MIILLIALVVFGSQRLPDVARSLGAAARECRKDPHPRLRPTSWCHSPSRTCGGLGAPRTCRTGGGL